MNDFIGTYRIPTDVCARLNAAIDANRDIMEPGTVFNQSGELIEAPEIKSCVQTSLNRLASRADVVDEYFASLRDCLEAYKIEYEWCDKSHSVWGMTEATNVQVYPPGGGYKVFHFERNGRGDSARRHLVFMTFLSDIPPDEGGGTEFLYQGRVLPCETGSTAIWPAEWTHTHRGVVSHTREKRIITGWFSYL